MAFKQSQSRVIIPIVEMTPMIDIVFLLIIFFMVAAQFAQQARVELQLPKEVGEQIEDQVSPKLIINIQADGRILIDNTQGVLSMDELDAIILSTTVGAHKSWETVTIRADKDTSASGLNDVLVLLNKHGLSATRIATETP